MTTLTNCQQLEENLRHDILSGKLPGNRRIPSETRLAKRYSICRETVRKALARLEEDGLLLRVRGSGTFVRPASERSLPRRVASRIRRRRRNVIFMSFATSSSEARFRSYLNDMPFFEIMSGIFEPAGCNLMVVHVGMNFTPPQCLLDREVDGILFHGVVRPEFWTRYMSDFPCVGVIQFNPGLNCSSVRSDPDLRAWLALSHLKELGHTRIGYIANEIEDHRQRERYNAFLHMKEFLGLPHRSGWDCVWQRPLQNGILATEHEMPDYRPRLEPVLSRRDAPTAFICLDNWRANCAEAALSKLGYSVPGDISLVGGKMFADQLYFGDYTALIERSDLIYGLAARRLLEQMQTGNSLPSVNLLVPPELKPGRTTAHRRGMEAKNKSEHKTGKESER